ncbi:MAG TPA: hypothetical protein VJB69_00675 [Candidatus Paceibacterota bacterium]
MASWSTRRQLTYFFGFFAVLIAAAAFAAAIFWPRPSCQDGRQNQGEFGVDCGGSLARGGCLTVCSNEALPLRALWARVLPLGAGAYDLVAFVRNPNDNLQAINAPYEIEFVDQGNLLINSVRGEVSLWPQEESPIFVPNIKVGKRIPVRAYFKLLDAPRWERSSSTPVALSITDHNFTSSPTPVLRARLANTSLDPVTKIDIIAMLADSDHNVFAVSATFTNRLAPGEVTDISFTWPHPFPIERPSFIDFYPHVVFTPSG